MPSIPETRGSAWLLTLVRHGHHPVFTEQREMKLWKVSVICNDTNSHNMVIKRLHDETRQDVKLFARVWTAEEARNNTVVTVRLHLHTEQTKKALLISSTLWLGNPQPVIDKWENHTASTSWLIKDMNIHAVSFGQEAFYKLLRQEFESGIQSFLLSSKIPLHF